MSDRPFAPSGAPPSPFIAGPSFAQLLAVLTELVAATNAQAQVINGSLGKPTSGDLTGILPGPLNVVATHLSAPLPIVQGGTGLAGGNAGGLLYFSAPGVLASSNLLTDNAILLGAGAGNAPAALASLGTATTVLHGNPIGPPVFGPVVTNDIANGAATYAKIQDVAGLRLLGNPTAGPAEIEEISLGATLAFVGSALRTGALTGDVVAAANSFSTTVDAIAGNAVAVAAWVPALEFGASSVGITYSIQDGSIIQLGRLAVAFFGFTLTSKGAAAGNATIAGLPFACGALAGVGVIGAHAAMSGGVVFEIDVPAGGTAVGLGKGNAVASAPLIETDFTNTTSIAGVALYITA